MQFYQWSRKMGQEKSLPDRCNSSHDYHSTTATIQRPPSRAPSTTTTKSSRSTYSTAEKQAKYLKEQLYIKSYLDIVEQDQTAKNQFQPAKPGIRNYTPKIYVDKPRQKDVDVWI